MAGINLNMMRGELQYWADGKGGLPIAVESFIPAQFGLLIQHRDQSLEIIPWEKVDRVVYTPQSVLSERKEVTSGS